MRYIDLLESSRASLYHWMDEAKAIRVLRTDRLRPLFSRPDLGKGISMTRNAKYSHKWTDRIIRLEFDQDKLRQHYKIYPIDAEVWRYRGRKKKFPVLDRDSSGISFDRYPPIWRNSGEEMAEEFVVGDIYPLHLYLKSIKYEHAYEKYDLAPLLSKYIQKWNIPLVVETWDRLQWDHDKVEYNFPDSVRVINKEKKLPVWDDDKNDFVTESLNEVERPKLNIAIKKLIDAGYKMLGQGAYGHVFVKPGQNYVLKLFDSSDDAYIAYVDYCRKHVSDIHLPKFRGGIVRITDNYYGVRIEQLKSLDWGYREVVVNMAYLFDAIVDGSYDVDSDPRDAISNIAMLYSYDSTLYDSVVRLAQTFEGIFSNDISLSNVMLRGDIIVMVDPIGVSS